MKFFLAQLDKQLHFLAGALVAVAVAAFTGGNILLVGFAPLVVGILKECCDAAINWWEVSHGAPPPHGVELLDAVATALPGWLLAAGLYFWKGI